MSLLIRSKSLHREASTSRSSKYGVSTPVIGRPNWRMGKWLPSGSPSSQARSRRYDMDVSPPLRERQLLQVSKQTPAIALLLRKLKELLPLWCKAMSEYQFINCCSLLAASMESPGKSQPSRYASPIFGRGSSSPASPTRSPIGAWFSGSTLERSDSNHSLEEANAAAVVESNLEVFFLLTGIESMYTSLAHANSTNYATLLVKCYEQAVKDLQVLRLNLSDAFLAREDNKDGLSPSKAGSNDNVVALTASLSFLVSFCQCRIQCIKLQSVLWHSSPDFAELATLFGSLIPNLQQMNPSVIVESLHTSVLYELGSWSSICRAASSAQQCRFAESVLAAQSAKVMILKMRSMRTGKDLTCLDYWLQDTLKNIIGIFPIIFDKTAAFASPLYGFDEDIDVTPSTNVSSPGTEDSSSFRNNNTFDAFEMELMDALHKYEKTGAISVSVVIDASLSTNSRVEAGFSMVERAMVDSPSDPDATTRQRFPAVFMRTLACIHTQVPPAAPPSILASVSPTATSSMGLPGLPQENSWKDRLHRRSGSRQNDETPPSSPMPSSPNSRKILKSWSIEERLSGTKKKKSMNTLEYGHGVVTGEGVSWPHSEWRTLVRLLKERGNEGDGTQVDSLDGLDSRSVSRGPCVSYTNQTLYCIEIVSECMWLVAIIKNSELPTTEWGWQTPMPSTEDLEDDIRELVANLASMLRIAGRFEAASTRLLRDKFLDRCSDEIGAGLTDEMKERGFEEGKLDDKGICLLIKNQLRLLTQVNMSSMEPGTFSLTTRSRLLGRRRRLKGQSRLVGHSESAAALFLGRELMSTLIDW